jgi:Nucleotide modification associated domain 2
MRLFFYIVANDYGLAPNPFWGALTLTVCKPVIRRTAKKDDWVIGTGSKNVIDKNGNRKNHSSKLVFAMRVDDVMSMRNGEW